MQFFIFARLIFIILAIVGLSLVFPILTALSCGELSVIPSFALPLGVSVLIGAIFYFAGKKTKINFSIRNVFAFVALAWISISVFGSVPLLLSGVIPNFYDALFESVSGFSTTGATILSDVESIPRSINFWRCQMHWLGGMGIIALTVALLPLLGVGSFQLIKAESTGPEKGQITPKMANTAKTLWLLYVGFTVAHAIALKICGMDVIDSICHAFSTLGTGGFSSKNASIGAYNSLAIEIVCTVFMFLAGVNFSLYFYVITGKFDEVKKNSELKAYISLFLICIGVITLVLVPHYGSFAKALRYSSFQVASVMTTTGYATDDFTTWPNAAQFFIFLLFFTGGCSGSTSGGFKIIRWVVLKKQAKNEMLRMRQTRPQRFGLQRGGFCFRLFHARYDFNNDKHFLRTGHFYKPHSKSFDDRKYRSGFRKTQSKPELRHYPAVSKILVLFRNDCRPSGTVQPDYLPVPGLLEEINHILIPLSSFPLSENSTLRKESASAVMMIPLAFTFFWIVGKNSFSSKTFWNPSFS